MPEHARVALHLSKGEASVLKGKEKFFITEFFSVAHVRHH
jgi:hypothetical protein